MLNIFRLDDYRPTRVSSAERVKLEIAAEEVNAWVEIMRRADCDVAQIKWTAEEGYALHKSPHGWAIVELPGWDLVDADLSLESALAVLRSSRPARRRLSAHD